MLYHFVILYVVYSTLCGSTHQTPHMPSMPTSSDLMRVQVMQYAPSTVGEKSCWSVPMTKIFYKQLTLESLEIS